MLGLIIDKIKEYNKLASESSQDEESEVDPAVAQEQENIYIGLIQLTGKIIDNFDISFSEHMIEDKKLIDEIFVKFLFASVFKKEE